MRKLLSIVFPLHNSCQRIGKVVDCFMPTIISSNKKVEFIFVDNCSTDGTVEFLYEKLSITENFEIVVENDYLEIEASLSRCVTYGSAEYILLWGDDDFPIPGFCELICAYLETYRPSVLHYNRFYGNYLSKNYYKSVKLDSEVIQPVKYVELDHFVKSHFPNFTFISSTIFKRKSLVDSTNGFSERYIEGYDFLKNIFYDNDMILFVPWPICYQSKPESRSWGRQVPLYRYLGLWMLYSFYLKEETLLYPSRNGIIVELGILIGDIYIIFKNFSFYRPYFEEIYNLNKRAKFQFIWKILKYFGRV